MNGHSERRIASLCFAKLLNSSATVLAAAPVIMRVPQFGVDHFPSQFSSLNQDKSVFLN